MDEKKIVKEEQESNIENQSINVDKEEENLGIAYEIVIGSTNG